ncbi:MAG: hypothetical protein ACLTMP_11995 [Eggerthella lenta]
MGDAQLALDLLMCDKYSDACALAERLEAVNDQRRAIEAELSEIAKAQAAEIYHGQRALVVSGESWHEGVKGIVASRLVNTYGVPALLFAIEGDEARRGAAWARSAVLGWKAHPTCSRASAVDAAGAHAAGRQLLIRAASCAYMDAPPEGAFHPLVVSTVRQPRQLTLDNVAQLDKLAVRPGASRACVPGARLSWRSAAREARRTTSRARCPTGAPRCRASCSTARTSNRSCAPTAW